jgi:hypothetical protein
MVAALLHHATIYSVLGQAARRRGRRGLVFQLAICVITGGALLAVAPHWWSVAAILGAVACYAAWGLAVSSVGVAAGRLTQLPIAVAVLGSTLAAAGLFGLAAAMFTGHGRSPYTPCGPGANSAYCRATTAPPSTTRVP